MNLYHVAADGQSRGPFAIHQLAAEGVRPETMIWNQAMPAWAPARDVQEVALALAAAWLQHGGHGQPQAIPYSPAGGYQQHAPHGYGQISPADRSRASSSKTSAGICGILLGGFGIHKFMLGMTGPGLIMLLTTLLTCGIGYAVMHVIGLIEGIIYLTKSDEEFFQTYMVQKKEWF